MSSSHESYCKMMFSANWRRRTSCSLPLVSRLKDRSLVRYWSMLIRAAKFSDSERGAEVYFVTKNSLHVGLLYNSFPFNCCWSCTVELRHRRRHHFRPAAARYYHGDSVAAVSQRWLAARHHYVTRWRQWHVTWCTRTVCWTVTNRHHLHADCNFVL